jgi:hypothetical protein
MSSRDGDAGMVVSLHHLQLAMPPGGEDTARSFYGLLLGLEEIPNVTARP